MADNKTFTPGTGGTFATDEIAGIDFPRVKLIHGVDGVNDGDVAKNNPLPVVLDTDETYIVQTGNKAMVNTANTVHVDLFNATGSLIKLRVTDLLMLPAFAAAVTGIDLQFDVIRTSTVGTGGTPIVPALLDTNNTALPATITARATPAGGAATATTLLSPRFSFEETANFLWYTMVGLKNNWLPKPITLNENQGLKVVQATASAVGFANFVLLFERV